MSEKKKTHNPAPLRKELIVGFAKFDTVRGERVKITTESGVTVWCNAEQFDSKAKVVNYEDYTPENTFVARKDSTEQSRQSYKKGDIVNYTTEGVRFDSVGLDNTLKMTKREEAQLRLMAELGMNPVLQG